MAQHATWARRVWRGRWARMTSPTGGRHDTPTPADAHPLPSTVPSPTTINTSCQPTKRRQVLVVVGPTIRWTCPGCGTEVLQHHDSRIWCTHCDAWYLPNATDLAQVGRPWEDDMRGLPECGRLLHPRTATRIALGLGYTCHLRVSVMEHDGTQMPGGGSHGEAA